MLAILQFIFSSFWIWFGTLILLSELGAAIAAVVTALRRR